MSTLRNKFEGILKWALITQRVEADKKNALSKQTCHRKKNNYLLNHRTKKSWTYKL